MRVEKNYFDQVRYNPLNRNTRYPPLNQVADYE